MYVSARKGVQPQVPQQQRKRKENLALNNWDKWFENVKELDPSLNECDLEMLD